MADLEIEAEGLAMESHAVDRRRPASREAAPPAQPPKCQVDSCEEVLPTEAGKHFYLVRARRGGGSTSFSDS